MRRATTLSRSAMCFLGLALCATDASAETAAASVATAKKAYESLDYDGCVTASKASLQAPATRSERVDAHRLLGLCKAALGDADGARDAFVEMLGVDPAAQLPSGLSPRFTSAFLEARGFWVGKEPLGLVVVGEETRGRTRILTLEVKDAAELIDSVAWRAKDGELGTPVKAAEKMELEVPVDVARDVVAIDSQGGVVAELRIEKDPPPTAAPDEIATATPEEEETSTLASPWLWAGVGGVAIVAVGIAVSGIVVGVLFYEPRTVDLQTRVVFAE